MPSTLGSWQCIYKVSNAVAPFSLLRSCLLLLLITGRAFLALLMTLFG